MTPATIAKTLIREDARREYPELVPVFRTQKERDFMRDFVADRTRDYLESRTHGGTMRELHRRAESLASQVWDEVRREAGL